MIKFHNFGPSPIFIISAIVVAMVIIIKWVKQEKINNSLPQISVNAKVLTKRIDKSLRSDVDESGFEEYYVTFEMENGERQEFTLYYERDYNPLIEGSHGVLTYQGTRYISFKEDNVIY